MAAENLHEKLVEELKDILHAEKQLIKALPKMSKAAENEQLANAFQSHLTETQGQVERLQRAFELLGETARAKPCDGMQGIVEEGSSHIKEMDSGPVLDAMLVGDAQKVEHYEIASYGTVIAWAEQLGLRDVAKLLSASLKEEKAADEKLTKLAEMMINAAAEVGAESEAVA